MPQGLDILSALRLTARMDAIDDQRNMPRELQWTPRIPDEDAMDHEIMARWIGRHQIADLIADDAKAVVYKAGKFQLETNQAPNIKHGVLLTQEELNTLMAIGNGTPSAILNDGLVGGMVNRIVDGLLLGIRWRCEALRIAMLLDGLSYDRLGIKMSGVTWGMPSDLKVTPTVPWTTAATATPVTDVLAVKEIADVRYGINLDRMTMSREAFRKMIATTEFQTKAELFISAPYDFTNLNIADYATQTRLAEQVMGVTIEFNDARYWSQAADAVRASARFLPIEKVLLTDSSFDGRRDIWDFANGIVTESLFMGLPNATMIGSLQGPRRGPISYATYPPDINPPNLTVWGVKRGFPRKHQLQSSAYLSVGTLTDTIAVTEPF